MVSEKKGRGREKPEGRGVIRTEADEGEKEGKILWEGRRGNPYMEGQARRRLSQRAQALPRPCVSLGPEEVCPTMVVRHQRRIFTSSV